MVARLAEDLEIEPAKVDLNMSFVSFGFSSMAAVTLTGDLDEWLGIELPATLAWDYPSIKLLARHLSGEADEPVASAGVAPAVEPIAIIGIGSRFPGTDGPEEFWRFVEAGRCAVSEVPTDRWDVDAYYDASLEDPARMNTRAGAFLSDVDRFDAAFFGISQREADAMDPQQRLLLEVAYEALEHAGVPLEQLAGTETGVFVAISGVDYYKLMSVAPSRAGTGVANCIGANRLSYFFDLQGPSMAIDTACSSSLVAVHQACQALRQHECPVALAGAVNLTLYPEVTVALAQSAMMAPDGLCKTFDARANGYVRGEGCGVVVLKRLADAERDGDTIWAVIRGSAVNQDGRSNGLTAPNGLAQQRVVRRALAAAGVLPGEIGFVEAHGSGTPLGDPIEVNALAAVLTEGQKAGQAPCYLGALKTNFGHLETAAGMASLIKAINVVRSGRIPPNLHFESLNPQIKLAGTHLALPGAETMWPPQDAPRRAGVSSFGFGGTNAHLILEQAQVAAAAQPAAQALEQPVVVALSARSGPALKALIARHLARIEATPGLDLAALGHGVAVRRSHFPHRVAIATNNVPDLATALSAHLAGTAHRGTASGVVTTPPQIAFLFAGQGALAGPGLRALYASEPAFRAVIDRCAAALVGTVDVPLTELLFTPGRLGQTQYAQPALFALGVAIAALWGARGVVPFAVSGHSLGEYVAACVAGVFDIEDGVRLVAARGRLMQALPAGGVMVAVFGPLADVAAAVAAEPTLAVAAINGPRHTVIAGAGNAVERALAVLEPTFMVSEPFAVSHAFHSPLMAPMQAAFAEVAAGVAYRAPSLPFVSNLTGELWPAGTVPGAEHWVAHVLAPVRFADGLAALAAHGSDVFLEAGPDATLVNIARRALPAGPVGLASLKPGEEAPALAEATAKLYAKGAAIAWSALPWASAPAIDLPGYPFQRKRCWLAAEEITCPRLPVARR